MNLKPPPNTDDIKILRQYLNELYRYIQYMSVRQMRFVPQASASVSDEGAVYYDSGDQKLKFHNGTNFVDV